MAAPTMAFQTYQAVGNREDLEDVMYMISPTETPFLSMAARTKATSTKHEWQTDALAAAAANAQIEGDDAAGGTSVASTRYANYLQISSKYAVVTDTQQAVNTAGRNNEMAHQVSKRLAELKRDMERALTQNTASTAGSASSARTLGSLETWLWKATGAATAGNSISVGDAAETSPSYAGGVTLAPTDASSTAAFLVANLKTVIKNCWDSGGSPGIIMVGGATKQVVSGFAGIATLYREASKTAKGTTIIGAADIYVSDFGEHKVVPNRFQRNRTAFCLDFDYWAVAYLRPVKQKSLGATGFTEKRFIEVEYTLVARNPASSGKIADLTP